ncbi:MAG: PP2C family protein-serine/threonine phosphatase [Pirellulales bacterium]
MSPTSTAGPTWKERLDAVIETMRDMSQQTDPQAMVRAYSERMLKLLPIDRRISLSRRGLSHPQYRVTRSSTWEHDVNPWKERHRLPLLSGGVVAEWLYSESAMVLHDFHVPADDPARELLEGCRSVMTIPMYDRGEGLNMVLLLQQAPNAFDVDQLPEIVWRSNLFGQATNNLVIKGELERAYRSLDREMRAVGDIQLALLPTELPAIPSLDLAAHYQPAAWAGGDYYDLFPLPGGQWGIFMADVSGHGTPAAVLMAVTHCLAHTLPGPMMPSDQVLDRLNQQLARRYARLTDTFVTAFYGTFDPVTRELRYSVAGHPPPLVKRCREGSLLRLEASRGMPLGLFEEAQYETATAQLEVGDQLLIYTDGITEALNPQGALFGVERLERELGNCSLQAKSLLESIIGAVDQFAAGRPPDDDRTLLVARVVR